MPIKKNVNNNLFSRLKYNQKMYKSLHFFNSVYEKTKTFSNEYSHETKTNSWIDAQFFFSIFVINSIKSDAVVETSVENKITDNLLYLKKRTSIWDIIINTLIDNIPSIVLILVTIVNPNELPIYVAILTVVMTIEAKLSD